MASLMAAALTLMAAGGCGEREPLTPERAGVELAPETTAVTQPLGAHGWPDYLAAYNAGEAEWQGEGTNFAANVDRLYRFASAPAAIRENTLEQWWIPGDDPDLLQWLFSREVAFREMVDAAESEHLVVRLKRDEDATGPLIHDARPTLDEADAASSQEAADAAEPAEGLESLGPQYDDVFQQAQRTTTDFNDLAGTVPLAMAHWAMFLWEQDEPDAAWGQIEAALRISATVTQSRYPPVWRAGHQSHAAVANVARMIAERSDDPERLRIWQQRIDTLPQPQPYAPVADFGERLLALDLAIYMGRHPEQFHAVLGGDGTVGWRLGRRIHRADWGHILREINGIYDRLAAEDSTSPADAATRVGEILDAPLARDALGEHAIEDVIIARVLHAVGTRPDSSQAQARSIAARDIASISLALRSYAIQHGSYPAALDALVPEHITELPTDPFASDSYNYEPAENGEAFVLTHGNGRAQLQPSPPDHARSD